jgi:type VI protein secretion system component Hcp
MELQRMAGNRAVAALIARDPKTKSPPAKAPAGKQSAPKQNHVALSGMAPIPIESAQFGQTRAQARTDREKPESTPAHSDVVITAHLGDHSSELFQRSLRGEPFSAEVVFVKPDGQPYLKVKLTNVLIGSYSVSGHGGGPDARPMESWTLNAEKIEFEQLGGAPSGGTAAP